LEIASISVETLMVAGVVVVWRSSSDTPGIAPLMVLVEPSTARAALTLSLP